MRNSYFNKNSELTNSYYYRNLDVKNSYFDKGDSKIKIIIIYAILILACFIALYPILNIITISLRPADKLLSTSLKIIPDNGSFDNFIKAIKKPEFLTWIKNSLIVSLFSTVCALTISVMGAYAFSRHKFRGKKMGLNLLLLSQMFPAPMIMLPLYILMTKMQLTDKYAGIIIVYIASAIPFNVWLMKGYFDTIDKSLEESAYVDGANLLTAFYKIILPVAKPGIAVAALFAFMGAWSEYIIARVLLATEDMYTLPMGLVSMQGDFTTQWGVYSAIALITAIPAMLVFILCSKYLVGGMTAGSVKG
ncbi:MAG: carbohydrate ABC transporter permease [Clostridia bacterium]|jgi:arabinogalactan oligomer/maltooligosaccharide transport system permease protein|nr:carbohydrate ABC transporter permease [Clostridia bacterium]